jgi:hypothetical protein
VGGAEDSNNDKWKETYSGRNYEKFFVKYHVLLQATPNSPKIFVRQFIHLSGLNSSHCSLTSVTVTYRVYTKQQTNIIEYFSKTSTVERYFGRGNEMPC